MAGWGDAGPAVAEWTAVRVVGVRILGGRRVGSGALLLEPMCVRVRLSRALRACPVRPRCASAAMHMRSVQRHLRTPPGA